MTTELEGFFPATVEFELQPVRLPDESETTAAERGCVAQAVLKRQREFLSGRAAARQALARLGIHGHDLLVSPSRGPLWPPGVVGSISHSGDVCLAAVALSAQLPGIGVDCAPDAALDELLWSRICTPVELDWIRLQPEPQRGRWARIFFCAKEAAYKYQQPLTLGFLGFQDLTLGMDPQTKSFSMQLEGRFSNRSGEAFPGLDPGTLLQSARGSWRLTAGHVIGLVHG